VDAGCSTLSTIRHPTFNNEETAIVTFPTRPFISLILTALLVANVPADDLPLPEPGELELPGGAAYPPGFYSTEPPFDTSAAGESSLMVAPPHVDYGTFDEQQEVGYDLWHGQTATPISSGTWLERGMWYVEAEAVVQNRVWNRDETLYASDDPNVLNTNFFPAIPSLLTSNRTIWLQGGHPGEDASVRTTLGRFLFRDEKNRDHTAEFTAFGGGDWVQDHVLTANGPNPLFTPFFLDGGNPSFDGSLRQEIIYSSRYNSFELNYRVKRRLGRDRMVMDPNGQWRREATNGLKRNFLIGLRYIELREILDWRAEDVFAQVGDDGKYLINTDNDLFGVQMGAGFGYESGRWSLGLESKGGFFVNDADAHSQFDFTVDDTNDFNRRSTEDELSFVGEARVLGRWHLTPSFSLRAGWEVFFLESLALAPSQVNFLPDTSKIQTTGYSFYMGGSLGFEGYW
jgi:hypothetical protein